MQKTSSFQKIKNAISQNIWKILALGLVIAVILNNQNFDKKEFATDIYPQSAVRQSNLKTDYYEESYDESFNTQVAGDSEILDLSQTSDRKIIKEGNLVIQVEDGEKAYESLKNELSKFDAFIENVEIYETSYEGNPKEANLNIRVASNRLEEFTTYLKTTGYVKSETSSSRDVTENYQDLEAELTNLKLREEKVREFYNNAKTVEETLAIYRELSDLQFKIENIDKNIKNIDKEVSYSKIFLTFTPQIKLTEFSNPEWNIKLVWKESLNDLIYTLQNVAQTGIKVGVYSVIWIPLLLIGYLIRKKYYKKS